MNTEPDPLAAVLAEMRREARSGEHADGPLIEDYADRIDAAAKRETESLRVEMESEKRWACEYFDLARRREDALAHCKQYAQKIERENEEGETRLDAEEIIATVDNEFAGIRPARAPGNAAAMRHALGIVYDWILKAGNVHGYPDTEQKRRQLYDMMTKALSAPPRNCDRFASAEEAVAAFADHLRAWENAHGIHSEYPDHPVQVPAGAFAWLFAPAEGGDHA